MRIKTNFKRVLLKLSGEVLSGNLDYGIDPKSTQRISETIKKLHSLLEIPIIVGGGIKDKETALNIVLAGASYVVIGTLIEKVNDNSILLEINNAIHGC